MTPKMRARTKIVVGLVVALAWTGASQSMAFAQGAEEGTDHRTGGAGVRELQASVRHCREFGHVLQSSTHAAAEPT